MILDSKWQIGVVTTHKDCLKQRGTGEEDW